jgi:hypothetical protein
MEKLTILNHFTKAIKLKFYFLLMCYQLKLKGDDPMITPL